MASDYAAIREANKAEYGNVGRWGRDLLANRYDSSAHFVFELLQNAEDALKRRSGWNGSREVRFELTPSSLRVVHCGSPFTFEDVKGVCGVGETTKDLTDIGRFGIGFKSVYAITDRPEVHSGEEDFAIENFVFPVPVPSISPTADQTVFVLPLRSGDAGLFPLIADCLNKLGARTFLFLRQVEEISWSVTGGQSGLYLRGKAQEVGAGSRRVTLVGERTGEPMVEETWLIFSREAKTEAGAVAGFIEIAFLLQADKEPKQRVVQHVDASPLSAFFPTVLPTHLGFLMQGPYRTTLSRDNVPPQDPWNVKLVKETAALLLDALEQLKAMNLLDVAALQCLPIERAKYPEGSMFAPLFELVRNALISKPLLPCAVGGWTAAKNARLARTQELRELFDSKQLAALLDLPGEVHWLSGDITRDTAATLRNYLLYELKVGELTPELILPRLTQRFLEAQPDEWILKLYEFLAGQPALIRKDRVGTIPLVRLDNGFHVVAQLDGQPQAFLPSELRSDFPTVRKSVCSTKMALEFLKALGLTQPEAVDDVVRHVIPKYKGDTVEVDREEYEADIKRILGAFGTQHLGQREKLVAALKEARFVKSVDAADGSRHMSKPGDVYLATERLKELFAGVSGVMLVDDSYACLKGEEVRDLLEACGAARSLRPVPDSTFSREERTALRVQVGHAETSGYNDHVTDWNLLGLKDLLETVSKLATDARRAKARLLWEELANLEERRGKGLFTGEYTWTHYGSYRTTFDAAFVRMLTTRPWIPDENGRLQLPKLVLFESLGWKPNPFRQSKIRFKPPILDQLAKEAGIEPGLLDLLKKRGITSETQLRELLGVDEEPSDDGDDSGDVDDALKQLGIGGAPTPALPDTAGDDPASVAGGGTRRGTGAGAGGESEPGSGARNGGQTGTRGAGAGASGGKRTAGSAGGRPFISYVAVHPDEEEPDPDGLDQAARTALEAKAIEFILSRDPEWRRTPTHNPGFDLFKAGKDGEPMLWCEAKAMTGSLDDRPVGLSHTQFEWACKHGEAYWLYVVEHAGTEHARVVRIQDPAGKARTFTFDRGWLAVAITNFDETPREN